MQVYEDNIGKYDQPKETYFDLLVEFELHTI